MSSPFSAWSRYLRRPQSSRRPLVNQTLRCRPALEVLEDRMVPASISIGDASALEGSSALKLIDRFISDGSGGLSADVRLSTFGPDGNLYVASTNNTTSPNAILRYDGVTGAFIDTFVSSGSGGLNGPVESVFGPDGNLYVSSVENGQVLRYDGLSGAFLDVVATGLSRPLGLTFGPDGSLYIANKNTNDVLRYKDGELSTFVPAGSGGLSQARKAVFGPDGNGDGVQDVYVASQGSGKVLRYDGLTGSFIDVFASTGSTQGPAWLGFGSDGYLYTAVRYQPTTSLNMTYVRFNGTTGALVDSLEIGRDGWSFNIWPQNVLYVSANAAGGFVDRFGPSSLAAFTVSLNAVSASPVTVDFTTASGSATSDSDFTATSGTLTFAPGQTTRTILIQTLNDAAAEGTETFTLTLSNPVGATITDGQATGTITDDEATKFFVVNDGSPDQTYRYGVPGNALAISNLTGGNTAPRGVASTAAGTTVWVVDANKTVYVYNNAGNLLGSWAAGSINGQPQIEGITTNGTDIWLVDAKSDKVYKYAGAASRLSGSQNAASSFALNSANAGAKDLVTDGTSLWVVNDSTTDKVFKYTVAGTLLGSWTIDAVNASPTGITINPANVSDLWIVDSGTKRVYQYTGAATRTSGSQIAAATFALAAGNTNPQGIADPPAPGTALTTTAAPAKSIAPRSSRPGRHATWAVLNGAMPHAPFPVQPVVPSRPAYSKVAHHSAGGSWNFGDQQTPLTPAVNAGARSASHGPSLLDGGISSAKLLASADTFFALLATPPASANGKIW